MNALTFFPAISSPKSIQPPFLWFGYRNYHLLVENNAHNYRIPELNNLAEVGLSADSIQYLGRLGERHCYSAAMPASSQAPAGMAFVHLRKLYERLPAEQFDVAFRSVQIVDWDRHNQFCGRCGAAMAYKPPERVKECPHCKLTRYPRHSPAVIVAVVKDGEELLLARSRRHPAGFYSVLAGFVDPGENLEETIHREIREEVGIEVKNIRYFGSQAWPFPDSLMIAFTAEYAGGDITIDHEEISDAAWFKMDEFPKIPSTISISRALIDWFVAQQSP